MVTNVVCTGFGVSDENYFRCTNTNTGFRLTGFENGVATIDAGLGNTIGEFISLVVGCFDEDSNFMSELGKIYQFEGNMELSGICFSFNGAKILVTKDFLDKDRIYRKWLAAMEKPYEEDDSYKKTFEYLRKCARMLKARMRARVVEENAMKAVEQEELCFKNEESKKIWEQWVEDFTYEGYTHSTVYRAERWAKYMQYLKKKHNVELKYVAYKSFDIVNCREDNRDGYEIVMILSKCWIHGEELSEWHKKYR